jgi:glycosyltransferase involved in cell wall biosynthesis
MRVLLISQHFYPETGATQNRLMAMAEAFVLGGHEVHVVASKPNHPEGEIWPEYRGGWFVKKRVRGFDVVHTWLFTRPQKSLGSRTLSYITFMLAAIQAGFLLPSRFDVVIASSPPPFLGVSGWILARWKCARYLLDVRDLWPGLAVALGELKNPLGIRLAQGLERFLYHKADKISAVTEPLVKEIRTIVGEGKPVELVMNGTTPEFFTAEGVAAGVRATRGWDGKFVVLYAGNVGVCQGLHHVLEAAKLLEDEAPNVRFVILGNGPRKAQLESLACKINLRNLGFLPRVELEQAIQTMSAADALLVPLVSSEMCDLFIPSKLFDTMACGRPVLLSVNGEARRILESAGGGLYYPAENASELATKILWLRAHPDAATEMGRRGRDYVNEHCLRSQQMKKLLHLAECTI